MSKVPNDRRYTEEHEWARKDGELIVIGITDHAQASLGDVVFLELPAVGKKITKGKAFGVIESVKAASDLYAPLDGEVAAVNGDLVATPDGVNKDAYDPSWMLKVKPASAGDFDKLMDAAAYTALLQKTAK
ncbi:MAG: glycine cleavage system protein GcvH [Deltaproteobacteria bacterium]|nr:glycine cleavage system protein GcvH [Deltaproteobacteria bacterium]